MEDIPLCKYTKDDVEIIYLNQKINIKISDVINQQKVLSQFQSNKLKPTIFDEESSFEFSFAQILDDKIYLVFDYCFGLNTFGIVCQYDINTKECVIEDIIFLEDSLKTKFYLVDNERN